MVSLSTLVNSLKIIVSMRFPGFNMIYFNKLANDVKDFGQ